MTTYEKNCSEPWFSLIAIGEKPVEGRLRKGDWANMNRGDHIIFTNDDFGISRKFKVLITSIRKYDTFEDYLNAETLELCLPTIQNNEDGIKIYRQWFNEADELTYGVVAIRVKVVH
jgi:ASC-1-like (ASCH) protein